jgi:hypothetical protein
MNMSNTCLNRLCLLGTPKSVEEAFLFLSKAVVEEGEAQYLDFELLCPVRGEIQDFEACVEARFEKWGTRNQLAQLLQIEGPDYSDFGLGSEASVHFQTRITPANRLARRLSENFPAVGIVLVFENENDDLQGVHAFHDGEVLFEELVTWADIKGDEDELAELLDEKIVSLEVTATDRLTDFLRQAVSLVQS